MSENIDSKLALDQACQLVGRFFYHFARVEAQLDAAITKLFKLPQETAPIITANIDFFKKINIAQSAIRPQIAGKEEGLAKSVEATFSLLMKENDARLVVAHSSFEPQGKDAVQFRRTIAKQELRRLDPVWTSDDFKKHFSILEKLESDIGRIVEVLVPYEPSLDFSDPRNGQYLALLT